jgi:hypothetical protein
MKTLVIVKKAVSTIVGIGTTKIVREIIQNNVDTTTIPSKVTVGAASVAIGYSVSELTSAYTDAKIDELVEAYDKYIKNRKSPKE